MFNFCNTLSFGRRQVSALGFSLGRWLMSLSMKFAIAGQGIALRLALGSIFG